MKKKNRRKPTYRHPRHYSAKLSKIAENTAAAGFCEDKPTKPTSTDHLHRRIRTLEDENLRLVGKVQGLESAIDILRTKS